ncbi:MAG: LysM peptidoglycan-binding domain-containing protein, partial [Anaerolineae bacterium]|nr:LysM peptidoglycan-binding domain-containing protein [Anaerolineae bacterium]
PPPPEQSPESVTPPFQAADNAGGAIKAVSEAEDSNKVAPRIPWGVVGVAVAILAITIGAVLMFRRIDGTGDVATPTLQAGGQVTSSTQVPTLVVTITPVRIVRTPTAVPPAEYVVQTNDNCGAIALKHQVPLNVFLQYNALTSDCVIAAGARLRIPPPTPTPGPSPTPEIIEVFGPLPTRPAQIVHDVKEGDICSKIASEYGVSVLQIIQNNRLDVNCTIKPGQKLTIVFATSTPFVTAAPIVARTPTPISMYSAPNLLAPVGNAVITSSQSTITLEWLTVGLLRPDEWYVVQVQPSNAITVPIFETKSSSIKLTEALLNNQPERQFTWWVQVKRLKEVRPNGERIYDDISPPSEVKQFVWRR